MTNKNDNPLLATTVLPKFTDIEPQHVEPAIDAILATNRAQIEKLLETEDSSTFAQLVEPMEISNYQLSKAWQPVTHLNAVKNNDELREAYKNCLAKLERYWTELGQNEHLYKAFQAVATSDQLDDARAMLVKQELEDFKLAGVGLPTEKKKRFADISEKISVLASKFSDNVLDCTQAWYLHVGDEQRLSGIPELTLNQARQEAKQRDLEGWAFTLDIAIYRSVMSKADDRDLRAEMYHARVTRASDQGPHDPKWDNTDLIVEIFNLRQEAAELLGFPNYVETSLAKKMAPDTKTVLNFLQELGDKAKPVAQRELDDLQAFAQDDLGESLAAWDIGYYSDKLKQKRLQFDSEALRPYFPVDKVMDTMFDIAKTLFGITFEPVETNNRWHEDVRLYRVIDDQGNDRGQFYIDLYARKKKRGGAWMDSCFGRINIRDCHQQPLTYLNCNFLPPADGKPALLTHDEIETLFHEFGHNLHGLLTKVDYPSIAGTNGVAWDAVELPSQFMENFIWQPDLLKQMSGHFETGEPLPDEKIAGLLKSRVYHSGLHVTRQLAFGWVDLQLHLNKITPETLITIVKEAQQHMSVIPTPEFNRFAHTFSHIIEGGYAAGYYSYMWADVLSADAFSAFEENGVLDESTGRKFMTEILEVGGSRDAMDAFIAFRGREPKPDALLRQLALIESDPNATLGL